MDHVPQPVPENRGAPQVRRFVRRCERRCVDAASMQAGAAGKRGPGVRKG